MMGSGFELGFVVEERKLNLIALNYLFFFFNGELELCVFPSLLGLKVIYPVVCFICRNL